MFYDAEAFDQPLATWNVAAVTDMSYMFSMATSFDQPLNDWDVPTVTNMQHMFDIASAFNPNLWTAGRFQQ